MVEEIFVFGSNLAGIHGAGAARYAVRHYGAVWGQGVGPQGHAYAIPTKDAELRTLLLVDIKPFVAAFIKYASQHRDMVFEVTAIGTGLAGYRHVDIAPLFIGAPKNCIFPITWNDYIGEGYKLWES